MTRSLAALFLSAVLTACFAGSASAAVVGLELVEATATEAPATATCPFGKVVVGAGGRFTGNSTGQVSFRNIRPSADLTSVSVQGLEDENGTVSVWNAHALAICASPLPGLERVAVTSASTSANKSVTAPCPPGKYTLGTGGEIAGGAGQVSLDEIFPTLVSGTTVEGAEDENGFAGSWSVTAYSVCADTSTGLQTRVATSPTDSSASHTATATCDPGKQLVGLGHSLGGGAGRVLAELKPTPALDGATVVADEDGDGTATSWHARVYAVCATTARRVTASNTTTNVLKTKTATCPPGTSVTGGGGEITSGGGQVLMNELLPTASGFRASGEYFGPNPPPQWITRWQLRAYAICMSPLPGRQVVSAASALTSSSQRSISVDCPAGKQVVGGGGRVGGGQGDVLLTEVEPDAELTRIRARAFEKNGGFSGNWQVYAYAVCATPPEGLELVSVLEWAESDTSLTVTATCPAEKYLLGAGGKINIGSGNVVLDDLRPNSSLTSVAVTGLEDADGTVESWGVTAHAICASP